ncbi:MAG: RsmE family RNA methyltransferase, partial [Chloroflexota bacterium]
RWRRIAQEAAEQAGRARLPEVLAPMPFARTCEPPPPATLGLIACLHPAARPLRAVLEAVAPEECQAVRLYIGPEGDFAPDEVARALQAGLVPISLGPRILRAETAPLAVLSVLLYALGELDRPAAFEP